MDSITKDQYHRGVLCDCGHIRGEHRVLIDWIDEEEEAKSCKDFPSILCKCGCVTFKKITNLRYLEILDKEKSDKLLDIDQ